MTAERLQIALPVLTPFAAIVGVAMASWVADLLGLTGADSRYVCVGLGAAIPLWVGYMAQRDAKLRWVVAALGVPWVALFFLPRSSIVVTWLSGGILFLGGTALVRLGRAAWRHGHSTRTRAALTALTTLTFLYFWLAGGVVLVNMQLLVAPVRIAHQSPSIAADERRVELETDDGYALEGTYTEGTSRAGVVLVHGVADGRDRWLPWIDRLRHEGHHALRFDLRAHGRSDGAVVTYGQRETADVRAAVAWLSERVECVAVVGTSMGGGITIAASPDLPVRAAIVLAPATRYTALVARRTALLGPLARPILNGSAYFAMAMGQTPMTEWSPEDHISETLPFLVFHGTADHTIPIGSSRALARRPNVELRELRGVGHDEMPAAVADRSWDDAQAFLARHLEDR